jgi:hypothetical protein
MCALPQPACPEFSRYMGEFRKRLHYALDENKWFLSERVGRDVGEQAATEDFLQHHFDRFAGEIRGRFCQHECGRHANCPLASFLRALPPTSKSLEAHAGHSRKTAVVSPAHT